MMDHLVVKLMLLSLSCQMSFDSSVLLESFLWVNVDLCWVYLCLKVPSVSPMKFLVEV